MTHTIRIRLGFLALTAVFAIALPHQAAAQVVTTYSPALPITPTSSNGIQIFSAVSGGGSIGMVKATTNNYANTSGALWQEWLAGGSSTRGPITATQIQNAGSGIVAAGGNGGTADRVCLDLDKDQGPNANAVHTAFTAQQPADVAGNLNFIWCTSNSGQACAKGLSYPSWLWEHADSSAPAPSGTAGYEIALTCASYAPPSQTLTSSVDGAGDVAAPSSKVTLYWADTAARDKIWFLDQQGSSYYNSSGPVIPVTSYVESNFTIPSSGSTKPVCNDWQTGIDCGVPLLLAPTKNKIAFAGNLPASAELAVGHCGLYCATPGTLPVPNYGAGTSLVTLPSSGNKTYEYKATNINGSKDIKITITTQAAPPTLSCAVTPNPSSGTSPLNVTWSATASGGSGTGYTYSAWGGGAPLNGKTGNPSPSVQYSCASGACTFTGSITVTDSATTQANCSKTVSVSAPSNPLTSVSCTVPSSGQTGTPVTWRSYPVGGSGNFTYAWTGTSVGGHANPLQGSTAANPAITYTTPDTYSGYVTVTDATLGGSKTSPNCANTQGGSPSSVTVTQATSPLTSSSCSVPASISPNTTFAITSTVGTVGTPQYSFAYGTNASPSQGGNINNPGCTTTGSNTSCSFNVNGGLAAGSYVAKGKVTDSASPQKNSATFSCPIQIGTPPTPPTPPTASLWATPPTIDTGQSSTLFWSSTKATSCTSLGGFPTGGAPNNLSPGVSTGALTTTSIYQINCTGPGGTSPSPQVTVTVLNPSLSITATPARVPAGGGSSKIAWNAAMVQSCTTSGPGINVVDAGPTVSDSRTVTVTKQSTYTITCTTNGAPITAFVIVNLLPGFQEF